MIARKLKPPGSPVLQYRIIGEVRRQRIVLKVQETFNTASERDEIDKVFRYTFIVRTEEKLRIETQPGFPDHAHFPPRFLSGTNRHFNVDQWPMDLQDMNFLKAFDIFKEFVGSGGQLPEPFRSAL